MRKYEKPSMKVERFAASVAVAGCTKAVTGTSTSIVYKPQTVTCAVGGQTEVVFTSGTSGCNTKSSQYCVGTYQGTTYFCWYYDTGASGTVPSDAQKKLMASVTGISDPRNWHYCAVSGTSVSTDILGLSY